MAYPANYLSNCCTDFHQIFQIFIRLSIINLSFVLQKLKERCYGNLFFALVFHNEFEYHYDDTH